MSEIENKPEAKRKGNPAWRKGGASPNPGGRPKNEVSITHWLKTWGEMSSAEAAELCVTYAKELKQVKGDLPIAAIAALRVWMTVMSEPTPGLFAQLLDRIDGPVPTKLEGGESAILIKIDR